MSKVVGIVKIYLDGDLVRSKDGATLNIGGFERTAQVGYAVYGYSEKVIPSDLEFTMSHMSDTDLITLRDLADAVVRFETDVGVTYVVTGAHVVEPPVVTSGEGDVSVHLMGNPATEE